MDLATNGTQHGIYDLTEEEILEWVAGYEKLYLWRGSARTLLLLLMPFALQVWQENEVACS